MARRCGSAQRQGADLAGSASDGVHVENWLPELLAKAKR